MKVKAGAGEREIERERERTKEGGSHLPAGGRLKIFGGLSRLVASCHTHQFVHCVEVRCPSLREGRQALVDDDEFGKLSFGVFRVLEFWSFGVLEFWGFGVLEFWRFWSFGVVVVEVVEVGEPIVRIAVCHCFLFCALCFGFFGFWILDFQDFHRISDFRFFDFSILRSRF